MSSRRVLGDIDLQGNRLIEVGPNRITIDGTNIAENFSTVQDIETISGTTDIDVGQGTQIKATLNGDTSFTFSGFPDTGAVDFDLRLKDADMYTITWPSGTLFAGSVPPDIIGSECELSCQIDSGGIVTVYGVIDDIG